MRRIASTLGLTAAMLLALAAPAFAGGPTAPANDNFADRQVLTGSEAGASGTNAGATKETGEPNHDGKATATTSVWYSWTAPATGGVHIDTCDSDFDTVLAVYRGDSLAALTGIASNDDRAHTCEGTTTDSSNAGHPSAVYFPAQQGATYRIAVAGFAGATGAVDLDISQPGSPSNDAIATALPLTENDAVSTSNVGASKEAGEPNHADDAGGASLWFTWTAPSDGLLEVDTCGSSFNTLLGLYGGSVVTGLTPLASNDNSDGCGANAGQSEVEQVVEQGAVVRIAVDGRFSNGSGPSVGEVELAVAFTEVVAPEPPANDNFASAEVLTGSADTFAGNNAGATMETGEPDHGAAFSGTAARSVWFSWTAPSAGELVLSLCDSAASADSVLAVYTGGSVDALTPVEGGADDDGCGTVPGPSVVTLDVVGGTTYRVAVADYAASGGINGPYELDLTFVSTGPTQECLDAQAALDDAEAALVTAKQRLARAKAALKQAKQSGKKAKIAKAKARLKKAKAAKNEAEAALADAEAAVAEECG